MSTLMRVQIKIIKSTGKTKIRDDCHGSVISGVTFRQLLGSHFLTRLSYFLSTEHKHLCVLTSTLGLTSARTHDVADRNSAVSDPRRDPYGFTGLRVQ